MKYMVMELHPGYAVVMDENGKFSKVANMRYAVGQTVTDVTPVAIPKKTTNRNKVIRWVTAAAAVAACLLMVMLPSLMPKASAYASVYMTINPEVRIDVDQKDRVIGISGENADGDTLISGYRFQKKSLDVVVDELVNRAVSMGFLKQGGKVSISLEAEDADWIAAHHDTIRAQLDEHLSDDLEVEVEVSNRKPIPSDPIFDDKDDKDDDNDRDDDEDDHDDDEDRGDDDDNDDDRDEDEENDRDDDGRDDEDKDDPEDSDEDDSEDDEQENDDSEDPEESDD